MALIKEEDVKRFLLVTLALFAASVFATTFSQGRVEAQDLFGSNPTTATDTAKARKTSGDEKAQLATKLVALMKTRAEMMTAAELKTAITNAEVRNNEIRAQRELERATAILTEIADKHPETEAAKAALRAKAALSGKSVLAPEPDPEFGYQAPEPRSRGPLGYRPPVKKASDPFDSDEFKID
jgi:hypothetical protein